MFVDSIQFQLNVRMYAYENEYIHPHSDQSIFTAHSRCFRASKPFSAILTNEKHGVNPFSEI